MAVTLTAAGFRAALRLGDSAEEVAEAARIFAYASQEVVRFAPGASDEAHNEAAIRVGAYLFDMPTASRGDAYAHAMRSSGARAILAPYRTHAAGAAAEGAASTPSSTPSGPAVDQTARDQAAEALRAAQAAQALASNAQTDASTASAGLNVLQRTVAALRAVPGAGTIGQVLKRIVGAGDAYGWANESAGGGGGGVDQTARDAATAAAQQAETNRVEIGRNSSAVTTARSEAARAQRTAEAAQDAVPGKATNADVDGETNDADFMTVAKTFRAIARRVKNASTTIRGIVLLARNEDVDASATDTTRVPDVARVERMVRRIAITAGGRGKLVAVEDSINPATLQQRIAGEQAGDLVIGYSTSEIAIFVWRASPTNAFVQLARWARTARTNEQLEQFIETIVEAWAIRGSAANIPGARTFDGLFKSEAQTPIPAANVTITFAVGDAADGDEVDETDAAASNFALTEQQTAEAGAFLRCRYTLERIALSGFAPRDIELLLQTTDGTTVAAHNIKDEGSGAAQFPIGSLSGAQQLRWATRVVTVGAYSGDVRITSTEYHSAQPLADKPMEHVAEAAVSIESDKRQAEDRRLTAEIARVEMIKSITNGLPSATATRKTNILWRVDKPSQQTDADAFQVPSSGFVAFICGNLAATGIMPVEYCVNRKHIIYAQGNHEVALNFNQDRKAIVTALQTRNNARSTLADDIAATTTGFVMLHWATARSSGHAQSELAALEDRVEALEEGGFEIADVGTWTFTDLTGRGIDTFQDTGVDIPTGKEWLRISPGALTVTRSSDVLRHGPKPWRDILVADIPTLTAGTGIFTRMSPVGGKTPYTYHGIELDRYLDDGRAELRIARSGDNLLALIDGSTSHMYSGTLRVKAF